MRKQTILLLWFFYSVAGYGENRKESVPQPLEADCGIAICSAGLSTQTAGAGGFGKQSADFFTSILDTHSWPDRWHCGTWTPFHGWLYIVSDIIIWLSYFMIPAILGFFVYKKTPEPIPFRKIVFLFIAFILACGLTHLVDAIIFWWPAYKLSALIRFSTAGISMGTVFALIHVTPKVLELKSPEVLEKIVKQRTAELHNVNIRLRDEILNRHSAEQALMHLNKQLAEKSERLELANEELLRREGELKESEAKILVLNADLERKVQDRTRELNAINEELEAFSYSVSHDLRAPLRSIHGYTNIIMEDYYDHFDEKGKENLQIVLRNAHYMGDLVDDLLDFSRTSRTKLTKEYFDARQQVLAIANDLKSQEANRVINIDIAGLEHCQADISMLRQVWINLISNAIKYTRKNEEARIEIGSNRNEQNVCYYVRDNGVGFDMAYTNKLFGVFQRLHKREDFEGTGVGLALVKRIIEKHGGRIWAEGKLNEGASFYFSLPVG